MASNKSFNINALILSFACFFLLFFVQGAQANSIESILKKGEQCKGWEKTGALSLKQVRGCLMHCFRYGMSLQEHPEILNDVGIKNCNEAYASAQSEVADVTVPKTETPKPPETPASVSTEKLKEEQRYMPDIEGVYLQATKSGIRVRVEGREEWKTYCNEAARIENGGDEFARTVKPYDLIRMSGITYDPEKANKAVTRCMAKSVTILGSGKKSMGFDNHKQ